MQKSAVSVVVPTFNRLAYLRAALDSVFAQTLRDWDLIIADDGSDEETRAYLREMGRNARVQVIWLPHSGIPAAVRNAGLRQATGEHVAFLDSDDLWAPRKLELQMAALRQRLECRWSYTAFTRVDHLARILAEERTRPWQPHQGEIFEQIVMSAASIRTPSVVASRRLLREVGGFDETLPSCEDYDLWMRLALRSPVALVDEPLVQVRIHEQNLTASWASGFHGRDQSLRKLQSHVGPRLRALLRRERARNGAGLMAEHARRGDREQMLQALLSSAPYSWRHPTWWLGALRAVTRPYLAKRPRS